MICKPIYNTLERCDSCSSGNVIDTRAGFVCGTCGLVLEGQKLEYHRPFNDEIVQCAVLNKTQMGFKKERESSGNSTNWKRLNRINSSCNSEESANTAAKAEIKHITDFLKLPINKNIILEKFKDIRSKLKYKSKYRSPKMLIPSVIYSYCKENNIVIRQKELLEIVDISKKDFNAFKIPILPFCPNYKKRNHKEYIKMRISDVTREFNLGVSFYYQSRMILDRFYESIKNTKDEVVVGLCVSITLLCSQPKNVKVNAICEYLGIKMSTIHNQVEGKFIKRYDVLGFRSLVKSAGVVKKLMTKLGVLDPALIDMEDILVESEVHCVEEITTTVMVFNKNNNKKYYFYVLNWRNKTQSFNIFRINQNLYYNILLDIAFLHLSDFSEKNLKFDIKKYYFPIGPPYFLRGRKV